MRELALATVIDLDPVRLDVRSRRLVDGSRVVALHINGRSLVEAPATTVKIQKGSFKLGQLPVATLTATTSSTHRQFKTDDSLTPRQRFRFVELALLSLSPAGAVRRRPWLCGPVRTRSHSVRHSP
ncbi:hypothetical protein OG799_18215 [Micromonospora sp. NBC_00898]|uniref:hypothetical protein n=1 Tax=Micromonospora sp. NBC_00898 TaxID=2975981 RepID=UPI00386FB302|nr:hypothetical protein OG799_18215 [Micromonospora sp. NBC_00898]